MLARMEQLDLLLSDIHDVKSAFTLRETGETDYVGHRSYHEGAIRAAQAEEAFWRELKMKLAIKGVWGILLVLIGLLVTGIGVKLGIWGNR